MRTSVRIQDTNHVDKYLDIIEKLKRKTIRAGILEKEDSQILMIANVNEYGVNITVTPKMRGWFAAQGFPLSPQKDEIKIPERPFIRGSFDNNLFRIVEFGRRDIIKVFNLTMSVDVYFKRLGLYCVSLVKKYMTDSRDIENSGMTIALKGSDNPLIDTGRLRASITYEVI
jgi:hypothetical protein